jgi:hypothetical protein
VGSEIDSSTSDVKASSTAKPSFKIRIKSLLSKNKIDKKNKKAKSWPVTFSTIPVPIDSIVPSNGYCPIKEMFNGQYKNGRYGLEIDDKKNVTDDKPVVKANNTDLEEKGERW